MHYPAPLWIRDGIDLGWFLADGIGSVRSAVSYRSGGWWFLPVWLPDNVKNDVGPFPTKASAVAEAERLPLAYSRTSPSL